MNPCELTAAITALANAVASGRTPEEISLIGALFVQLGDTLATIAAQKACNGHQLSAIFHTVDDIYAVSNNYNCSYEP